ncbi:MAG: holo-ACP synthase [Holosporales bacterium]|jgi:holo-[acyl-carrier protein] synthase|nr:holo-ACP synthase [Holosporales bacterium]
MILGLGNDLVDITRIDRLLDRFALRFLRKVFTPTECTYAFKYPFPASILARRFAAKEACAKALGVGLKTLGARTKDGVLWEEVEVLSSGTGQPSLKLTGSALVRLKFMTPPHMIPSIHVSLSDQHPYALATVILTANSIQE